MTEIFTTGGAFLLMGFTFGFGFWLAGKVINGKK